MRKTVLDLGSTSEEWKEFVEECSDRLFDCCLVEGQDLLEDWSITNLNKLNRDLSIDQIVKLNDWNRERNEQNETVT